MMCCDMAGERNAHQGDVQRFEAEQHVIDWFFYISSLNRLWGMFSHIPWVCQWYPITSDT